MLRVLVILPPTKRIDMPFPVPGTLFFCVLRLTFMGDENRRRKNIISLHRVETQEQRRR